MGRTNLWSTKVTPSSVLNASNATVRYDKIYVGTIMATDDPENMGRVLVYIPEISGAMADEDSWFMVNYATPFGGATSAWPELKSGEGGTRRDGKTYQDTQQSYGFWGTPVHVNNQVLVAFASGDPSRGYYFASVYQKDMNHMVPGIASSNSYQGDVNGVNQPVAEYNKNQSDKNASSMTVRAAHPLRDGLQTQGLSVDGFRGVSTSSARRESPSRVLGMLSPGGSQFVMDDGDPNNEHSSFIRLRTSGGAQLIMSDTYGHVYIISRDGNSWIELNNEGYVDIYSKLDISVHSETNLNLRADQDINVEAGRNINMKAVDGSIFVEASDDMNVSVGANYKLTVAKNGDIKIDGSLKTSSLSMDEHVQTDRKTWVGGDTHIKHPNGGVRDWGSKKVYVIADSPCIVPIPTTIMCKDVQEAASADQAGLPTVNPLPLNKSVTTSITTRVPEHEPWAPHTIPAAGASKEAYEPGFDPSKFQDMEHESSSSDGCTEPKSVAGLATSANGKRFIASFGGPNPYSPYAVGKPGSLYRMGYSLIGELSEHIENYPFGITEEQAWKVMERELVRTENIIRSNITADLTQSQFDALVSLVHDQGIGVLGLEKNGVRLRDLVNNGEHDKVVAHFALFDGDTSRRRKEAILYKTCNYGSLGDRCTWLKKGLSDAKTVYKTVDALLKKQIQGSFWQMNQPSLPGGDEYMVDIKATYPQDDVEKYKSACINDQIAKQGSGKLVTGDVQLSPHFTLNQFIQSDTATKAGIPNTPTEEEVENLRALCINVLEPLLGMPGLTGIRITSGYRSPALNSYMASGRSDVAKRSQHSRGQAADIQPQGVSTKQCAEWISKNLQFDQLIHEARNSRWVHVSWNRAGNRSDDGRTKVFSWNTMTGVKYYGKIADV